MVSDGPTSGDLPSAVEGFLADAKDDLKARKADRYHFYPLLLNRPLDVLFDRRKRLFDTITPTVTAYGYEVTFERHLKKSKNFPDGRTCQGEFYVLKLGDQVVLVVSKLSGDDNDHGPLRLVKKAYPLARRPFFPSTALVRLVEQFAIERTLKVTVRKATGHHRQSRSPRIDFEKQSPSAAAQEMAEQGRQVHKFLLSYRYEGHETTRVSFDRTASATVITGVPRAIVRDLILPGIAEARGLEDTYRLERAQEPSVQEVVELDFPDQPFDSYDAMRLLCDAVRQADGLNVSIIHLNPYLQSQILDFFTGEAVELLITTPGRVSLLPRSANCAATIERVATTIYRHFGEAKARRIRLED